MENVIVGLNAIVDGTMNAVGNAETRSMKRIYNLKSGDVLIDICLGLVAFAPNVRWPNDGGSMIRVLTISGKVYGISRKRCRAADPDEAARFWNRFFDPEENEGRLSMLATDKAEGGK